VPYTPSHWGEVPPIYGLRVTGSFLVGDRWLGRLWNGIGYPFVYGSIAVVLALALYAFWRRRDLESRLFVAASAAYSFGLMAASLKVRGTGNFLLHGAQFGLGGSRYTVISILPLYGIAIAAFERREPRLSPRVWRGVQVVVLAAALVVVAANFRIITTRSAGPAWHYGIAQARLKCAGKLPAYQPGPVPSVSGPIHPKASDQIAIFVSPLVLPRPPWAVFATCKQIQKKWF
jgi:hypothetical protein